MHSTSKTCPSRETLADFLLGKLPPGELDACQTHLAQCPPCGDTIRDMDVSDTVVALATGSQNRKPTDISPPNAPHDSDLMVVNLLIDKLKELQPGGINADAADRAAEITRLLEKSDQPGSLGRIEHYEIKTILGIGATSVVFRAHDQQLRRQVALKVLRPSLGKGARERFLAEARAAAAIDHENVVTIYQVSDTGSLAFMAMQWLPGETLESRLNRETKLTADQVQDLARQIANGLSAAHAANLIHRDIKPANIWLESQRNRVIILDFGLVRVTDDEPQMTDTGMIAGTPSYMSPEQTRGKQIDERSDLFSLGCLLYRACTGQLPFPSTNTLATLQSIQFDEPTAPHEVEKEVPSALSQLVMALLEKNPDDRLSTAYQVAAAISDPNSLPDRPAKVQQRQRPVRNKGKNGNRTWRWVASLLLLTGLLAAAMAYGPQIIRVVTDKGILEIETSDPNVAIEVLQDGKQVHLFDQETGQKIEIHSGTYQIRPTSNENEFELSTHEFVMKRGGKVIVTVTRPASTSSDDGIDSVPNEIGQGGLSVQQLVDRVAELQLAADIANEKSMAGEISLEIAQRKNIAVTQARFDLAIAQGDETTGKKRLHHLIEAQTELIRTLQLIGDAGVADKRVEILEAQNVLKRFQAKQLRFKKGDRAASTPLLTYEDMTYEQWMGILDTERSPERLTRAIDALRSLRTEENSNEVATAIVKLMSTYPASGLQSENLMRQAAVRALDRLPHDVVFEVYVQALRKADNTSVRHFLENNSWWNSSNLRGAIGRNPDRFFELLEYLFRQDKSRHWLYHQLSQKWNLIGWDKELPDRVIPLVNRAATEAEPRERIFFLMQLVKYAAETAQLEDRLLDLLTDRKFAQNNLGNHFDLLLALEPRNRQNTVPVLLATLNKELARAESPDQADNQSGRKAGLGLGGGLGGGSGGGSANSGGPAGEGGSDYLPFDLRLIQTLGRLGPEAKKAVPLLEELNTGTEDSRRFVEVEFALHRITRNDKLREDLENMQGNWRVRFGDSDKALGKANIYGLRLELQAPVPRSRTTQILRFTDVAGQIDLITIAPESEAGTVRKGIYEWSDNGLQLGFHTETDQPRPRAFVKDLDSGMIIWALERDH